MNKTFFSIMLIALLFSTNLFATTTKYKKTMNNFSQYCYDDNFFQSPEPLTMGNNTDSVNYSYGFIIGTKYLKDVNTLPQLNRHQFNIAFKKFMIGNDTLINIDTARAVAQSFIIKVRKNKLANDAAKDSSAIVKLVAGKDYDIDSVSNSLAIFISSSLKENFSKIPCGFNPQLFTRGFFDAFNEEKDSLMSTETAMKCVEKYANELKEKQMAETAMKNKQFIDNYKQGKGINSTEDGILYRTIVEGNGKKPKATNTVKVHYTGRLTDGTVFDSSEQRGKPAEFALNQVIPGWTEILQLMPIGSKWEVVIPPELGYGSKGAGSIPPNSVLVFVIELIDIVK